MMNSLSGDLLPSEGATPKLDHLPAGMCCPACRGCMAWDQVGGTCLGCGRLARLWGNHIPDYLGGVDRAAAAILDWPGDVLPRIERGLLDFREGRTPDDADRAELVARDLVCPDGRLTELGRAIDYSLAEHRRQAGDDFIAPEVLDRVNLGSDAHVLDVGCGAGQSLRQLAPRRPAERIGLDIELKALTFGHRLAEIASEDLRFIRASGNAIPFKDGRFTHVLCRGAVNYMHQRMALGEMVRVLRPGGVLYCRFLGPGRELFELAGARGVRPVLGYLRELASGLTLELTGRQFMPSRFTGYRAYGTTRHIGRILRRAGCEIISVECLQRYGGLPAIVDILARKREVGPHD